jgi:hypothetical protein
MLITIDPNTLQPAPAGVVPVLPRQGGRIAIAGVVPDSMVIYAPFGEVPLLTINGWAPALLGVYTGYYTALFDATAVAGHPTLEATLNAGWRFHVRVGEPAIAFTGPPLQDQIDAALAGVLGPAIAQAVSGATTRFHQGRFQVFDEAVERWLDLTAKKAALRTRPSATT